MRIISGLLMSTLVVWTLPSRANELDLPGIVDPVPEHVGLTVQKSPVLYFYLSHATSLPIHFTLADNRRIPPVAEVLLSSPAGPGFVAIRLKDHHIVLEEDVQYRWYVSVIPHPALPQQHIVAGGVIERIDPRLIDYDGHPCDKDSVLVSLKAGVWIDAFACVIELIEANPEDPSLRDLRDEVLAKRGVEFYDSMRTEPRYPRPGLY